jgi:hypothetical protein
MAVIQQSIWRDFVAEQLIKNNEFLKFVKPVSQANIINGRSVNIPNAGALPGVTVNDATVGGTIGVRTDTVASYDLNWFRTNPVLIDHLDEVELSYDKTASVMKAQTDALSEAVGNYFFYWMLANGGTEWTPGTNAVVTSGSAGTNNSPAYTANRLMLTLANLMSAGYLMSRQGVPKNDRFAVLPTVMYYELMAAIGVVGNANTELIKGFNNNEGKLLNVAGFNVMERASVAYGTSTGTETVVAPTAGVWTEVNTMCHAGICFQSEAVEFALGDVKLFETKDSAEYYGSIYSGEVRAGGRPVYSGNYGIVPIFQVTS